MTQFKIKVKNFKPESATPFIVGYKEEKIRRSNYSQAKIVSYKDDILTLETPLSPDVDTISLALSAITDDPEHRAYNLDNVKGKDVTKEILELESLSDEDIESRPGAGNYYFDQIREILYAGCWGYSKDDDNWDWSGNNTGNDLIDKILDYTEHLHTIF